MNTNILIRGGGDLSSGVAARLHRVGFKILITELAQPLVVRRTVSFAEAVFSGQTQVEEIIAEKANNFLEIEAIHRANKIAVVVDPKMAMLSEYKPSILVDARMMKQPPNVGLEVAEFVVGLGPGFLAGDNCHAVVETMRGHTLGRVIWQGKAIEDTGIPDAVEGIRAERVLRAGTRGLLKTFVEIGQHLEKGDLIAEVNSQKITSPFKGVLRGLMKDGIEVKKGMKIGDVDPRNEDQYIHSISDKALSIGGGALEAILSQPQYSIVKR